MEPAAMLIRSFEIKVRRPFKVLAFFKHEGMGRTGIALTLVSDRDLGSLKEILRKNSIEPQWQGPKPDLDNVSRSRRGGNRSRGRGASKSGSSRQGRRRGASSKSAPAAA